MKYKVIIFDFVGVLVKKKDVYKPNPTVDGIDQMIGQVINDDDFKAQAISKYNLSNRDFEKIMKMVTDKYEAFLPLWNLLPQLKKKYKLAIINNGTAFTIPIFKSKFPIDKYFNYFISSAIEGIRKPDKEIYLLATRKLKVNPRECIFMDDSSQNVETANKLGMKTVLWENHDYGFEEFTQLLK